MLITVLLSLHYNQTENYQMEHSGFIYALWSIWHLLWSHWKCATAEITEKSSELNMPLTHLLKCAVGDVYFQFSFTKCLYLSGSKLGILSIDQNLGFLGSLLSWLRHWWYHLALSHERKGLLFLCGSVMDGRPVSGVPHVSWWRHAPAPCDHPAQ